MTGGSLAAEVEAAWTITAEIKRQWQDGESPNATLALAKHPELSRYRSVVIDLVYTEYLEREKNGDAPDLSIFADQFPSYRTSVRDMLDAYHLLREKSPDLEEPVEWPQVGSQFEGLNILTVLGQGALGRAYLTFDTGTDRLCVLKLAPEGNTEGRVIGRLDHPHVTEVYWARAVQKKSAVCMPFVGLMTLTDIIDAAFGGNKQPKRAQVILDAAKTDLLPKLVDWRAAGAVVRPKESYLLGACAIGAKMASAVAYLHETGVVHGDLKPSNIVIGPGGSPQLIDFNLSSADAPPSSVRGTPAYMAPELLDAALTLFPTGHAATSKIDAKKTDVFAIGVILYELMTGRHPFESKGTLSQLSATIRRGLPEFPASIPLSITNLIGLCLAPDPATRPTSQAVATVLDQYVKSLRTRGRRRLRLAVIITGLVIVVIVGAKWWYASLPPETGSEFFEQGRRYLSKGDVISAQADFVESYKLTANPWAQAYAAYCMALNGQSVSVGMGELAIEGGADSAEVRNNTGFALYQANKALEAIHHFNRALEFSPGLQAPLYNRAMARYRMCQAVNPLILDVQCVNDITAALAAGPQTMDLHFDAARIYLTFAKDDAKMRDKACAQIQEAITAGKDAVQCRNEVVRNDRIFGTHLVDDPQFVKAFATTRGPQPKKPIQIKLIEPRVPAS